MSADRLFNLPIRWRNNYILMNNGNGPRDLGYTIEALNMYSDLNKNEQDKWIRIASTFGMKTALVAYKNGYQDGLIEHMDLREESLDKVYDLAAD